MLRDVRLLHGDTFATGDDSLAYAEEERQRLVRSAWVKEKLR